MRTNTTQPGTIVKRLILLRATLLLVCIAPWLFTIWRWSEIASYSLAWLFVICNGSSLIAVVVLLRTYPQRSWPSRMIIASVVYIALGSWLCLIVWLFVFPQDEFFRFFGILGSSVGNLSLLVLGQIVGAKYCSLHKSRPLQQNPD